MSLNTLVTYTYYSPQVWVRNSQKHGVVELCAFKEYIEVLEYFIELDHEKLPVWKNLLKVYMAIKRTIRCFIVRKYRVMSNLEFLLCNK